MLVPPKQFASAAEIARSVRTTKAYFRRLQGPPLRVVPEPEPPKPPPPQPPTIEQIISEVVEAVSTKTFLASATILVSLHTPDAIEARRVAMAICVLHCRLGEATIARAFNVSEGAVLRAAGQAERIYLNAAVPRDAGIYAVASVMIDKWPRMRGSDVGEIGRIKRAVCHELRVSMRELNSDQRYLPNVVARHAAMALSKRITAMSVSDIGRRFGRDHSTIIHACNRMAPFMQIAAQELPESATLEQWVKALCKALHTQRQSRKSMQPEK